MAYVVNAIATVQVPTAPQGSPSSYVVREGDTACRISAAVYQGNPNFGLALLAFNNINDPRLLTVGTILTIPS